MRSKQKFEKARGRPSIQEMNYKSVQREEEKRKQKKSFGEDTRKKMRSIGMRDAAEDEAGGGEGGESGDSSSSKVGRVRHFVNGGAYAHVSWGLGSPSNLVRMIFVDAGVGTSQDGIEIF